MFRLEWGCPWYDSYTVHMYSIFAPASKILQFCGEERHRQLLLAKDKGGAYGYAGVAEPHTQAG